MPDQFQWDVFLSHSHWDRTRVARLAERLRERGLRVWLDDWVIQPGDDIYAAIENGLDHSRTLLLCLSQAAIDSDWVKLERNTTLFRDPMNNERRFVPVLLEECQLPATLGRFLYVDWRAEADAELAKLIEACAPPPKPKPAKSKPATEAQPPPSGAMPPGHPRYLERPADADAMATARRPPETLIVRAPRQMGKSSLLKRYLAECQHGGKRTALLYLSDFQEDEMAEYPTFLTQLARELRRALGLPPDAALSLRNQRELTNYIEDALLTAIPEPIVFAFDEVDHVLGRAWQSDFASTLRLWHERRADPTPWSRLGLALVTSTEPYLFVKDSSRSPFNVGLQIELPVFAEKDCQKLAKSYGLRLAPAELAQMMALLGGHPYLTQLACYHLTRSDFAALDREAAGSHGPFGSHLRAMEKKLEDAGLLETMRQLAADGAQPDRDTYYRLHGAGLARERDGKVATANELYKRFFRNRSRSNQAF
jgi:hypothetical protein